jgi:hypothetical protein
MWTGFRCQCLRRISARIGRSDGAAAHALKFVRIVVMCAEIYGLGPFFRCAVSASGFHVAVAGKCGLLLYNRHSAKWRCPACRFMPCVVSASTLLSPVFCDRLLLQRKYHAAAYYLRTFGNVNHERQVSCEGLAWYGEHIVAVATQPSATSRPSAHAG